MGATLADRLTLKAQGHFHKLAHLSAQTVNAQQMGAVAAHSRDLGFEKVAAGALVVHPLYLEKEAISSQGVQSFVGGVRRLGQALRGPGRFQRAGQFLQQRAVRPAAQRARAGVQSVGERVRTSWRRSKPGMWWRGAARPEAGGMGSPVQRAQRAVRSKYYQARGRVQELGRSAQRGWAEAAPTPAAKPSRVSAAPGQPRAAPQPQAGPAPYRQSMAPSGTTPVPGMSRPAAPPPAPAGGPPPTRVQPPPPKPGTARFGGGETQPAGLVGRGGGLEPGSRRLAELSGGRLTPEQAHQMIQEGRQTGRTFSMSGKAPAVATSKATGTSTVAAKPSRVQPRGEAAPKQLSEYERGLHQRGPEYLRQEARLRREMAEGMSGPAKQEVLREADAAERLYRRRQAFEQVRAGAGGPGPLPAQYAGAPAAAAGPGVSRVAPRAAQAPAEAAEASARAARESRAAARAERRVSGRKRKGPRRLREAAPGARAAPRAEPSLRQAPTPRGPEGRPTRVKRRRGPRAEEPGAREAVRGPRATPEAVAPAPAAPSGPQPAPAPAPAPGAPAPSAAQEAAEAAATPGAPTPGAEAGGKRFPWGKAALTGAVITAPLAVSGVAGLGQELVRRPMAPYQYGMGPMNPQHWMRPQLGM